MSTRSMIGIVNENGTISANYCHWDGYPSNNGVILRDHFDSADKVFALLEFGDISSLGETIEECEFYARDRGEGLSLPYTYNSVDNMAAVQQGCEYFYVFNTETNSWSCFDNRLDQIDLENV